MSSIRVCVRVRGRRTVAVLVVVATGVLGACGSGDSPQAESSASVTAAATSPAETTVANAEPATTIAATTTDVEVPVTDAATTTEPPATAPATDASTTTTTTMPGALQDLGFGPCGDDRVGCVGVAISEGGVLVSYDPSSAELTFHEAVPYTVVLVPSVAENVVALEAVGPDDVAYFSAMQPEADVPVGGVVAVSADSANPGEAVGFVDGLDMSGDSSLFPQADGLHVVGCCGGVRRPAADSSAFVGWVDHTGAPIVSTMPVLWIDYATDGSGTVSRQDGAAVPQRWTITGQVLTRSMPVMGSLADGGVIVDLTDPFDSTSPSRLVRLHPDGTVTDVAIAPATAVLVEPTGSVIVRTDAGLFRSTPFPG